MVVAFCNIYFGLVAICDRFFFIYVVCHISIFIFEITNCDLKRIVVILGTKVVLLAFKPLLHNPFLGEERKINSIIAMIVLLVIASLVARYLPLYHTTLPHPELNIPCEADLLLPYIRLSSVLPFYRAYLASELPTFLYILLPSWQQSAGDIITFQLRTGRKRGYHYRGKDNKLCLWLIEHKLTEQEFTTCGEPFYEGAF